MPSLPISETGSLCKKLLCYGRPSQRASRQAFFYSGMLQVNEDEKGLTMKGVRAVDGITCQALPEFRYKKST